MNLHIITIESLVNVNTIANTYHCEEHPKKELPPMYIGKQDLMMSE